MKMSIKDLVRSYMDTFDVFTAISKINMEFTIK